MFRLKDASVDPRHDPFIDAFRGVAVLFVLVFHAFAHHVDLAIAEHHALIRNVISIPDFGTIGVDLFFILSGFLITRVLMRTRSAQNYYSSFFSRRALRILPLYYLVLVFLLFVSPRLIELEWFKDHQIYFWIYLQNWILPYNPTGAGHLTHLWSLSIEEQFYLFWPFIVRRFRNKDLVILGLISLPMVAALRWFYYSSGDFSATENSMNSFLRLDRFLLGAALAALLEEGISLERLKRWSRPLFLLSIGGVLFAKYAQLEYAWRCIIGLSSFGLAGSCLLVETLDPSSVLHSRCLLGSRTLQNIGQYSYAIYLVHLPILYAFYPKAVELMPTIEPGVARTMLAVVSGVVSYLIARVTWTVIEHPCIKLKKHFKAKF